MYQLQAQKGQARAGLLKTRRGAVKTPFFMPIATKGSVKTLSFLELDALKPEVVLSNTYHLLLRPGEEAMEKFGGLHSLMNWQGPILTDSGGYQVFSLAQMRKIHSDGVEFSSHLDGKKFKLTPEDSLRVQESIGADIMMVLDECVELPAEREYLEKSVALTSRWADRAKEYFASRYDLKIENRPLLFGIIQGGLERDLRETSLRDLAAIDFDGYAVGGLAVGESEEQMYQVLDYLLPQMPLDKPRYLMGVGYPQQIVRAVKAGVDMFDCVIPTREARHGRLYLFNEDYQDTLLADAGKEFYRTVNIFNEEYRFDLKPLNAHSAFDELRQTSRAYLRLLFQNEDPLAARLATLNNLEFYLTLMRHLRSEIMGNEK